jgi:hypothetical protein
MLNTQFIAMDANFKLKSKARNIRDEELSSGGAYFVEASVFEEHVKNAIHYKEVCATAFGLGHWAYTLEELLVPVDTECYCSRER